MIALIYDVFSCDMWCADRDNGSKAKDLTIKLGLIHSETERTRGSQWRKMRLASMTNALM